MEPIDEFADERQHAWCLYCRRAIAGVQSNLDHVPSRVFLLEPTPEQLPTVRSCYECNNGFSRDEEYFAAFLGAVISDTTDPAQQKNAKAAKILSRSGGLRRSIERSRRADRQSHDDARLTWEPQAKRIRSVVLKNARGHAFFELSEPMLDEPDICEFLPLELLNDSELGEFEAISSVALWPEVGSRMMERILTGADLQDGWIVVQPNTYRYSVAYECGTTVKTVIWNYLATLTHWSN
jgi:hypothetical protein